VTISHLLDEKLIIFLDVEDRNGAIQEMVRLLESSGKLRDPALFQKAILEREKLVSTGIGMGVAIPHAKLEGYRDFFIAVGISPKRGIDWNALDQEFVQLVLMIGGPEKEQKRYLQILSNLTAAIKDPLRRKQILKASTPKQVIALFERENHGFEDQRCC
jgi:PTS system nitrogen regulatory IIA component